MAEQEVGYKGDYKIAAHITIRDKDGNVKFDGPVEFIPIDSQETSLGSNTDNSGA